MSFLLSKIIALLFFPRYKREIYKSAQLFGRAISSLNDIKRSFLLMSDSLELWNEGLVAYQQLSVVRWAPGRSSRVPDSFVYTAHLLHFLNSAWSSLPFPFHLTTSQLVLKNQLICLPLRENSYVSLPFGELSHSVLFAHMAFCQFLQTAMAVHCYTSISNVSPKKKVQS